MKPLRVRVAGFIDVVLVQDPEQIRWLNQHADVQRALDSSASWLHRLINRRLRGDLGFARGVLPVFLNRADAQRSVAQTKLHERLAALCNRPSQERDRMADYVSGGKIEIGPLVQQWCGKLFSAHYRSTRESYEAGKLLATWPSSPPWRAAAARRSRRLAAAKQSIAELAGDDLHCVHGTSIGMENIVKTLQKLRDAAASGAGECLSADAVLHRCLAAPGAILRGCRREFEVPFLAKPLTPQSLIVFQLARAYASTGDLDDAFLGNSWSECPAREVVPELLREVWRTAEQRGTSTDHTLFAKISSLGCRLRAVAN